MAPEGMLPVMLTGLVLALPAASMPFVTVGRFGRERVTFLSDVAGGLWRHDMTVLAALAWFCGVLAPLALLALLLSMRLPASARHPAGERLERLTGLAQYWAMPEVQVLAVLVAFSKLGEVVDVTVGAGLWCYAASTACLIHAWRLHRMRPSIPQAPGFSISGT